MNIRSHLESRISAALQAATGLESAPAKVGPANRVAAATDYQASGVMAAAKIAAAKPRDLAQKLADRLAPGGPDDLSDLAESITVAGPGFLNIKLRPDFLSGRVAELAGDDRLGVARPDTPQTVVVDYSAPNLAKEMHVGHLRSTIIGDALARILDFQGHTVIRQNHVGDWGRQFGIVILGMWHLSMCRHRDEPDYVHNQLDRLQELTKKDPAGQRRAALEPVACRQIEDGWNDRDGTRIFHPFIREIIRTNSLPLPELEEAYRFVYRVEELAEGTGLLVPWLPTGELVPLSELSRYVTSHFLQRPAEKENEQEVDAWEYARMLTLRACQELYDRIGPQMTPDDVRGMTPDDVRGESFYGGVNPDNRNYLPEVVSDLKAKGLLTESQGAQCVFLPGFVGKDGQPLPLIIQKSDEGYLYATTDLAAIRYRVGVLHADRVLYVVDVRQGLHFKQVFATARLAGFDVKPGPADGHVQLEHVSFGTMLGPDGKPFKTRTGGTVKLVELLDEAEKRAFDLVTQKNADDAAKGRARRLEDTERRQIARVVGIGAVKYADLSQNRNSDYVFSFDKMLALDGNTAPYMQYAYARIRSIFRKDSGSTGVPPAEGGMASASSAVAMHGPGGAEHGHGESNGDSPRPCHPARILLDHPAERGLALKLLQLPEILEIVAQECLPNLLCGYLYELAVAFTGFYENCPVLQSAEPLRASRLALCELTARIIHQGLELLGIETVEQM